MIRIKAYVMDAGDESNEHEVLIDSNKISLISIMEREDKSVFLYVRLQTLLNLLYVKDPPSIDRLLELEKY